MTTRAPETDASCARQPPQRNGPVSPGLGDALPLGAIPRYPASLIPAHAIDRLRIRALSVCTIANTQEALQWYRKHALNLIRIEAWDQGIPLRGRVQERHARPHTKICCRQRERKLGEVLDREWSWQVQRKPNLLKGFAPRCLRGCFVWRVGFPWWCASGRADERLVGQCVCWGDGGAHTARECDLACEALEHCASHC